MKTQNLLLLGALCLGLTFIACQKEDHGTAKSLGNDLVHVRALTCGDVVVTAPTQVCVDEEFTISVVSSPSCGRVKLQQENLNSACDAAETDWTDLAPFTCHNVGFPSWTGSFSTPGIYTFRSMHNANAPTSCGSGRTNCSFSGNNFCCFDVEVVECCGVDGNEFNGEAGAGSCDGTRSATYTFGSEEGENYVKIQGGLNNFTGADATVTVSGGTLIDQDQWTPGQSSNRIIRVEASLAECETVTITITWDSENPCDEDGCTITGEWSAKDEHGVDLAPAVPDLICSPE